MRDYLRKLIELIKASLNSKQEKLVSGTSIKTINGESVLGEGNIVIQGGEGGGLSTDLSNIDEAGKKKVNDVSMAGEVGQKLNDLSSNVSELDQKVGEAEFIKEKVELNLNKGFFNGDVGDKAIHQDVASYKYARLEVKVGEVYDVKLSTYIKSSSFSHQILFVDENDIIVSKAMEIDGTIDIQEENNIDVPSGAKYMLLWRRETGMGTIGAFSEVFVSRYKSLSNSINEINTKVENLVNSLGYNVVNVEFEIGSINSNDNFVAATDKARCITHVKGGAKIILKEGYIFYSLHEYGEDKTIKKTLILNGISHTERYYYASIKGYVRFVVVKKDGTNFTPEELSSIVESATECKGQQHNKAGVNIFKVCANDLSRFVEEVDYSDDASYTSSLVDTYRDKTNILYNRAMPVMIIWHKEEGAVGYKISLSKSRTIYYSERSYNYHTTANKINVYNLLPNTTYYYAVSAIMNDGTIRVITYNSVMIDGSFIRPIYMPNVCNARDLGGWTTDTGIVKYGLLFRSAGPKEAVGYNMSSEGVEISARDMNIKTEIALGLPYQTKSAISDETDYEDIPISAYIEGITGVSNENYVRILKKINSRISSGAVWYHCAQGCDRTGTLSWLLLGLLGVSESDLSKEYECTSFNSINDNRYRNATNYHFKEMVAYVKTFDGATLKDKVENWWRTSGATEDDITSFRENMIQ